MKYFLVTTLSLIYVSCANSEKSMQASENENNDSQNGLICKFEEVIGSHVKKRVCYTQRQMDRQREIAQEALRRSSGGVASNPNP